MQGWKQNLNLVSRGWQKFAVHLNTMRGSWLAELFQIDPFITKAIKMLGQTRELKVELKKLRILHVRHEIPAIEEAQQCRAFLHPYYSKKTGVKNMCVILRTVYQDACRYGKPYAGRAHAMILIERKRITSIQTPELNLLDRCIYFIQLSRISKAHNYQWRASTPSPVLPEYVRKAVQEHREKYGSQSIY